jgi:hypothetical protein
MRNLLLSLLMLISLQVYGQVTIDVNTLPDIGDVLEFRTFRDFDGDTTYRAEGENLSWSFDDFLIGGTAVIDYPPISGGLDTIFPDATIALEAGGFAAAGIRTDNTIEVIGVAGGNLQGFAFNPQRFPEPFIEIQRPLNFGDSYETSVDLPFTIAGSALGLDSLDIPVSIDSVRITSNLYKKETVDAWGNLELWDNDFEVLKVTRLDSFSLGIELQVPLFGWVDLETLLSIFGGGGGDMGIDSLLGGFGTPMGSVSYAFYTPDRKEAILEFQENEVTPPMSEEPVRTTSGRISADIPTATKEVNTGPAVILSPNPATDRLTLTTEATSPFSTIQVVDSQGKVVFNRRNFDPKEGLDVSNYTAGTYMLVVWSQEGYTTQMFVVANRH